MHWKLLQFSYWFQATVQQQLPLGDQVFIIVIALMSNWRLSLRLDTAEAEAAVTLRKNKKIAILALTPTLPKLQLQR